MAIDFLSGEGKKKEKRNKEKATDELQNKTVFTDQYTLIYPLYRFRKLSC